MKTPLHVLLVDDDRNISKTLALSLKQLGTEVTTADGVLSGLEAIGQRPFDLVLTDFRMGEETGLDLIRKAKVLHPDLLFIVMTAFASFENAVEVVREGAFDYLPKPFTMAQLEHALTKVRRISDLRRENRRLRLLSAGRSWFEGLGSPASRRLEDFVRKIAPTEATVLLSGESGTGKSGLARLIHDLSPRASKPFATVYCTTLAETLLESELFGHVKGAFTGATSDKVGKVEVAEGGTLFLDEVGELSASGQSKLLRLLQDKVFEKVGSNREIHVDARIVAATNRNLAEDVKTGKFREDLYYRLNILECKLPPLRERSEDLPVLIEKLRREISPDDDTPLPPPVLKRLLTYPWPGNIRELRNAIERVSMLSKGRRAQVDDLPDAIQHSSIEKPSARGRVRRSLEEVEKEHIEAVLGEEKNLERASEILGITSVTLWRKRKEYGL